jgi:hypothetical protein
MLISQLYRSNPDLNERGYEILQNWYKLTNEEKHRNMLWLADQLRNGANGKTIAVELAARLRVKINSNFPPP